ncbi:hypothetical protein [Carboxylicivirga sp. RSCT41]|uniref:hypothetical protein n=1 Tax=Carboxylicivirga agarovorans TaxID=3417570 RepID=UPI003D3398D5
MVLFKKHSFCISLLLLVALMLEAQIKEQKFITDSLWRLYNKNLDTVIVKNWFYCNGNNTYEVSQFLSRSGNFSFSVNSIDQKFCDTTVYYGVRQTYNPKNKIKKSFYYTESYSLINEVDTLYGRFNEINTSDLTSQRALIEMSYMLGNVDNYHNYKDLSNCIKVYFYSYSKNDLLEFYLNLDNTTELLYRHFSTDSITPVLTRTERISTNKISQRLIDKFKKNVTSEDLDGLSQKYLQVYTKDKVDRYCLVIQFLNNKEAISFIFGDEAPKVYKKEFRKSLFHKFSIYMCYPILKKYGFEL